MIIRVFFIVLLASYFIQTTLVAQVVQYREQIDVNGEVFDNIDHISTMDRGNLLLVTTHDVINAYLTLVKLDSSGTFQWYKRLGQPNLLGQEIVQCPDSGYFFTAIDVDNDRNVYGKVNKNGAVIFSRTYFLPATYSTAGSKTFPIARRNGGFYIASTIYDSNFGVNRWQLSELDSQGIILWSQIFTGTYGNSFCHGIDTTLSSAIVLYGYGIDSMNGRIHPVVIRTDSIGNIQWYKSFKSPGLNIKSMAFDIDAYDNIYGSALLSNFPAMPNSTLLMKIDSSGNTEWANSYVINMGIIPSIVNVVQDSEIVVLGTQYFLKVNNSGLPICARKHQQLWIMSFDTLSDSQYTYAGMLWVNPARMGFYTSDNCGNTCLDSALSFSVVPVPIYDSTLSGRASITLAPLSNSLPQSVAAISTQLLCTDVTVHESQPLIWTPEIYPSPTEDFFTINSKMEIESYEIIDHHGKTVLSNRCFSFNETVNISNLSTGIYFIRIFTNEQYFTKKIIIAR